MRKLMTMMMIVCCGLLNATNVSAQDTMCSADSVEKFHDKVTGKTFYATRISKKSVATQIGIYTSDQNDRLAYWSFTTDNTRCIGENAVMYILFRDQTRIKISSSNPFNCESEAAIYFGRYFTAEKEILKLLSTKKVDTVRFHHYYGGYSQIEFTQDESEALNKAFKCVSSWVP